MIIVSQEKDAILNFDNVIEIRTAIDIESNKETRIAIDTIEGERYYIARYSTEERAKEVLNEIVKKYADCLYSDDGYGSFQTITIPPKVYKMPEE